METRSSFLLPCNLWTAQGKCPTNKENVPHNKENVPIAPWNPCWAWPVFPKKQRNKIQELPPSEKTSAKDLLSHAQHQRAEVHPGQVKSGLAEGGWGKSKVGAQAPWHAHRRLADSPCGLVPTPSNQSRAAARLTPCQPLQQHPQAVCG